jgi:hypothetical protein
LKSYLVIISSLLFLLGIINGQAATDCIVSGKVTDINTGEALNLVNVYISGTTYGASTSDSGVYCIERVPSGTYQLVFQHIGYEIEVKSIQIDMNQTYTFNAQLNPQIFNTDEISIQTAYPEEWQEQLEFFVRQFIGESENGEECEIINPHVLNFATNDETEEFIAKTDSILQIKNNSLGYLLKVAIADFKCIEDYLSYYHIYPRFELLKASDADEQERWENNRSETYQASLKHFFSTLARNKMSEEHFKMLEANNIGWFSRGHGTFVDENALRISDTRSPLYKRFYLNNFLKISYSPENIHPPSIIFLNQDFIVIDTLGNVITPQLLQVAGYWYERRVADLLPMDYLPEK